ncbi:MAG: hypothetical protein ACYCU6_14725, partial [Acidimicrobiales bacterium]
MTEPDRPADHVASLLSRLPPRAGGSAGGVVVDLASGSSVAALDVEALGLEYLGVRTDPAAASKDAAPGDASVSGEPLAPGSLFPALTHALRGRRVAAVAVGDALNRVEELGVYLGGLRELCDQLGGAPVLVASPNVAHLDVAAKLLIGRWDVTTSGT